MATTNLTTPDQFHPRDIRELAGLTYRQLQVWDGANALPDGQEKPKQWRAFTLRDTIAILVLRTIQLRLGIGLEPLGKIQADLSKALRRANDGDLQALVVVTDLEKTLVVAPKSHALKKAAAILGSAHDAKCLVVVNLGPIVKKVEGYTSPRLTRRRAR